MEILIALIPALAWGSIGIVNTKMGGSAGQQTLGMTLGALLFGIATMIFYVLPRHITFDSKIIVVGLLSGLFWSVGTAFQFQGIKQMGVSLAIPLSTVGQITTNAIMAAFVLGDWKTSKMWMFGSLSIALVLIGAVLISSKAKNATEKSNLTTAGLISIAISTFGYMMYFVLPNLLNKVRFISNQVKQAHNGVDYMTSIVAPMALGQVFGALIIMILIFKEAKVMFKAPTWRNIVTGLVWSIGSLFMFISAANPKIGQAMAATFSQMGIIVGVFGGIFILGEKKTRDQMVKIIIGSILVVIGGILIGNLANL